MTTEEIAAAMDIMGDWTDALEDAVRLGLPQPDFPSIMIDGSLVRLDQVDKAFMEDLLSKMRDPLVVQREVAMEAADELEELVEELPWQKNICPLERRWQNFKR